MLERAASNAYSWWWASNIRTKQSTWLDCNLQEMEEKVKTMIKLIEVDADSFAKKAEMYYQRRPELIKFVEETYKAYKALADRYDHISGELQKANHTLASACPVQLQLALQDEDEDCSSTAFKDMDTSENNEARSLMAATAIKSCKESLVRLQQQQKKSGEEAEMECKRIREVRNRLKFFKGEKYSPEIEETFDLEIRHKEEEGFHLKNEGIDLYSVCAHVKQHFQMNSDSSVADLAEKIDELVEEIISLEVKFSSQTAQARTLRSETDMLQKHLQGLEENKVNLLIDSESLNVKLRQAEDELYKVQDLEKIMHHEKGIFRTDLLEACHSLNDLSEKLQSPSPKEKDGSSGSSNIENLEKNEELKEMDRDEILVKQEVEPNATIEANDQSHSDQSLTNLVNSSVMVKREQLNAIVSSLMTDLELYEKENIPVWQKLLSKGPIRQKLLLHGFLENFDNTKKRVADMVKKNQEYHFEMIAQIQELKSENAVKDQEIRDLRRKLFYQTSLKGATSSQKGTQMQNKEENGSSIQVPTTVNPDCPIEIGDVEEEIKLCHLDQQHSTSPIEEKFRAELDTLLDDNLNFWLRFSTSYHQIQNFVASFKALEAAPASPNHSSKDTRPLDKKLREFHTELQVWVEQNDLLKVELQCRFTFLCNIQEEISQGSRDTKLTPYQAAKFHGELLNLQQENNKVAMELQTGMDHVKSLQNQVAKALLKLKESFDLSVSNEYQQYQNFRHCSTKSKIPLRTFLFGKKRKKPSLFSCISPALYRNHSQVKSRFSS